jgi:predicted PurR-regulated permease PerM
LARPNPYRDVSYLLAVAVAVIVIATLYLARVVLVPFALAMLFSFLLTPAVIWLERIRFPRALAVSFVVVVFVAAMGSVGWTVADQLVDVTNQLPNYTANIKNKIESLRSPTGQILNKATDAVVELSKELAAASTSDLTAGKPGAPKSPSAPLSVQVVSPPTNWLEYAGSVLGPLGTAGIAIVFTIFMLMRREDLRDRFIRLAGRGRLSLMTQALDDAAHRVSRYVFLEFVVNSCYGLVVGVALHFIGIPNALLWGVGAGVLRFLPYIGPPLGAILPILLSLAVFDGWTRALITIGLFVVSNSGQQFCRAESLWSPNRNLSPGRPDGSLLLDAALGTDRPGSLDPFDCVPGGYGPPRPSLGLLARHSGRRAGSVSGSWFLPASAGDGSE